jgi:hypothetical protein
MLLNAHEGIPKPAGRGLGNLEPSINDKIELDTTYVDRNTELQFCEKLSKLLFYEPVF